MTFISLTYFLLSSRYTKTFSFSWKGQTQGFPTEFYLANKNRFYSSGLPQFGPQTIEQTLGHATSMQKRAKKQFFCGSTSRPSETRPTMNLLLVAPSSLNSFSPSRQNCWKLAFKAAFQNESLGKQHLEKNMLLKKISIDL